MRPFSALVIKWAAPLYIAALLFPVVAASTAALFVPDNSVRSRSIVNGTVKTVDLKNGAVTSAKIRNGAIINADIAAGASISPTKINTAGLNSDLLDNKHASDLADAAHNHDATYVNNDADEVDDNDIADGAVSAAKIAGTAWTGANDGPGSGLDADTIDGSTAVDFAGAVHLHDDRYFTETETSNTFVNDDANEIDNNDIADGAISAAKIAGTAWTALNDGPGSGLDADLLDGSTAADFSSAAHDHDDSYYRLDRKTPAQIALLKWYDANQKTNFSLPGGSDPYGIAFDGANMWVANYSSTNVTRIDAATGDTTSFALPGGAANPRGIAFDGANMWTANYWSDNVTRIAVATGDTTNFALPGGATRPISIAFDGANMWTANYGSNNVTRVAVATGAATNFALPSGATQPYAVAFDGANMWTANYDTDNVTRIHVATGDMTNFALPGGGIIEPTAIAFDGANIWTANLTTDNASKL